MMLRAMIEHRLVMSDERNGVALWARFRKATISERLVAVKCALQWSSRDRWKLRASNKRIVIMTNEVKATTFENTKLNTVPLDWKEVYYTNCPLVSASNVDQELGWTREEYKKIGVKYAFLRSARENDWYPHYIHNLDNLIRFGGLFPPVHVHADIRRTRLLGVTHAPHEGGCMMVRARDDIYRMAELKGKKIGLSKSMNQVKNDWWRIQEHQGIKLMLRMNGMTMRRRGDRGVPLCGRLVQQSRHAGPHGKPVGIVAQA